MTLLLCIGLAGCTDNEYPNPPQPTPKPIPKGCFVIYEKEAQGDVYKFFPLNLPPETVTGIVYINYRVGDIYCP
ncbi:hypothetical protein SAMN04487898_105133 [Pedobacter sp. ok626]|uniref:hypothetical protein n=1 Tax=Pedobacter sp. ok626 TaxID=1761882 RepID=UPI00088DFC46|nr:hypothetical protein [Pedobacter sp. ok626]SDJ95108.1 hypothetical protein SAMN04487898_105133 [Pedobacter sp. ok626]